MGSASDPAKAGNPDGRDAHLSSLSSDSLDGEQYPARTIKAWIGHGSEMMIRRYAHLRPDCFEKHLAVVPDVLAGIAPKSPLEKRGLAA
jgi:hypothetical protein